jgi:carbon-monoxide dehydrogenase small subunit
MELKQHFTVAHPPQAVWDFFGRLEAVTPCMPGASLAEPPAMPERAKFKLNVKLGPITATFVGDAEVERHPDDRHGTIRGTARDTKGDSRVKGFVNYVLREENHGKSTAVDIDVDFALTGRLAQFSRGGVVADLASRLTADFARNLEAALNAEAQDAARDVPATVVAAVPAATNTAPSTSPPAPANELNAGSLLMSVLLARLAAFFRSLFRRP